MAQGTTRLQPALRIGQDNKRLAGYVEGIQGLIRRANVDAKVFVSFGRRYVKVFKAWGSQHLVHSFVDRANGNVLKAESWRKPVLKSPRSNVFDKDYGLSGVEWTGAKYITQLSKESK